ncbi:MAG: hypothetical protein JNM31_00230 [Flavobacteriales bacterium]|nr:hypothetical protein [Flavobacteriales bacterium]
MRIISTATLSLALSPLAMAQVPGDLDISFANNGKYIQNFGFQDNLTKVRVQPWDQKIIAVGTAINTSFSGQLLVMRLNPDGTLDTSFDGDGYLIINDFTESYAYDLVIRSDEKIVVVGTVADPTYQFATFMMRLKADGSLDATFGTGGMVVTEMSPQDDMAHAVVELTDGSLLLAGRARNGSFLYDPIVTHFSETGVMDMTFGTSGMATLPVAGEDNNFWSLGVNPDGSIIASGHYASEIPGSGGAFQFDVLLAKFSSVGQLDPTFGTGGVVIAPMPTGKDDQAFGQVITPAGDIVVCGYTTLMDFTYDMLLMAFDAQGSSIPSFGTSGVVTFNNADQDVAYGIERQNDGRILVAGTSGGFIFNDRDFILARYLDNGTLDAGFGTGGVVLTTAMAAFDEANALTLQADGKILVAGKGMNGSNNDAVIMRHLNDGTVGMQDLPLVHELSIHPNPARSNDRVSLRMAGTSSGQPEVRLMDLHGRTVQLDVLRSSAIDNGYMILLPGDLAAGCYTVVLQPVSGAIAHGRLIVE